MRQLVVENVDTHISGLRMGWPLSHLSPRSSGFLMRKRWLKIAAVVAALVVVAVLGTGYWAWSLLAGSLPQVDGEYRTPGLAHDVKIERDGLGIPTIRAANRKDLAFATGFAHGQDRFFQMDLLRRNSAGELAELVGSAALPVDRRVRVHRFRNVAQRILTTGDPAETTVLESYTAGVNAGLASLRSKPFEYYLLGVEPAPWKTEDSALVMFSMFLDLQGDTFDAETTLGLMHDELPGPLFDFLRRAARNGTRPCWASRFKLLPCRRRPSSTRANQTSLRCPISRRSASRPAIRRSITAATTGPSPPSERPTGERLSPTICTWASACRTSGIARRSSGPRRRDQRGSAHYGLTLPGTPAMVVGSNGHIAWGFTNTQGGLGRRRAGRRRSARQRVVSHAEGPAKVRASRRDDQGQGRAGHHARRRRDDLGPGHRSRQQGPSSRHALGGARHRGREHGPAERSNRPAHSKSHSAGQPAPARRHRISSSPTTRGRIGWTIMGRIPRRIGFDGRLPSSWADGKHRWDGYLKPEEYPRIIDPADGRIWTANARVVSGDQLARRWGTACTTWAPAPGKFATICGSSTRPTKPTCCKIQLDDRAVFLTAGGSCSLDTLDSDAVAADPRRGELKAACRKLGRPRVDRFGGLPRPCDSFAWHSSINCPTCSSARARKCNPKFSIAGLDRTEGPVWQLVSEAARPPDRSALTRTWKELLARRGRRHRRPMPPKTAAAGRLHLGPLQHHADPHPLSAGRAVARPLARYAGAGACPATGTTCRESKRPTTGASERHGRLARPRERRLSPHALRPIGTSALAPFQ